MVVTPTRAFDYRVSTAQVVIARDVPALIRFHVDDWEIERRRGIGRRRNRHPRRLFHALRDCRGTAREIEFAVKPFPIAPCGISVPGAVMLGWLLLILRMNPAQAEAIDYPNHGILCNTAYDKGYLATTLPFTPKACDDLFTFWSPEYRTRGAPRWKALVVAAFFARLAEAS
jgi:hypothetical protein